MSDTLFVKIVFVIPGLSMFIKKEKMQSQSKFVGNSQNFAPTSWTEFSPLSVIVQEDDLILVTPNQI